MKKNTLSKNFVFLFAAAVLLISCESLDLTIFSDQAWYMSPYARNEIKGSFTLLGVTVDRTGTRDSIQREAHSLVPLYFWKEGYRLNADSLTADYAVDVQLREREYTATWRTRRSISVEVRIYDLKKDALRENEGAADIESALPLAVGRMLVSGDESLASSKTTGRVISLAVKRAVRHLGNERRGIL